MDRSRPPTPAPASLPSSLAATAASMRASALALGQSFGFRVFRRRLLFVACALLAGSLFGAGARAKQSLPPVASMPALKHTEDGELQRWAPGRVRIVLDPSLRRISPEAPERVMKSFGTWLGEAPELPDVEFVNATEERAGPRRDGKNTVSYAPIAFEGHGRELGITVTYSDPESGEILEADIVFNALHPLAFIRDDGEDDAPEPSCVEQDRACEGYDFESVATHEAGHFFGLGEDRSVRTATMFFCQSRCEVHKRSLEPSDTRPLRDLYAGGAVTMSQAPGCGKGSSTSSKWND